MQKEPTQATVKKDQERLYSVLDELAGDRFTEDDIKREGTQIILPTDMDPKTAVATLLNHIEQHDTVTEFSRSFRYRPWDVAAAFERAIRRLTGTTGIQRATYSFFGKQNPQRISVPISINESMDVPWGMIEIALFGGTANLTTETHPDLGLLGAIIIECPREHRARVEALFMLIQNELDDRSIYKGKAFDGQVQPGFIDLNTVDPTKVVYSAEVIEQAQANIWSLLEHDDIMRELGIPLKRAILLHGDYGTGKTLMAFITAQKAIANGWTFIYCRPGKDNFDDVMMTAQLYPRCVVFVEDVDNLVDADGTGRNRVTVLLDLFDGITAKGTELMIVLTTNHPEKIHKGMVRPGRLDAVIHIGALDTVGIGVMIEAVVPANMLGDIDVEPIGVAMEGFMPAFVKEGIDRAMRYAIARTGGIPEVLTTEDFVRAGEGLRPQLAMMEEASEGVTPDSIDAVIVRRFEQVLDRVVLPHAENTDYKLEVISEN
jgi:transitional endoplasmic reticulum ATPase